MNDEMPRTTDEQRARTETAAAWRLFLQIAAIVLLTIAVAAGCALGVKALCGHADNGAPGAGACRAARVVDALLANLPWFAEDVH